MAENEVGRISLGVELSTAPLSSQAAEMEREVISIAEKAGEKAGKKFADEAAKAFEKNTDKLGETGEKAGEEASKGVSKGLKAGSKTIETETGTAGEKAGKTFFSRFSHHASGAVGGLKAIAGKIGKTLVAAFAAKKLFDFGKTAVNLGSDLAEVQNVVDSTFGQGSQAQKSINDFAKNAATQFGLSETMAKRYTGTFGAMGKAFGFTGDQAADMGATLTGLAGDVASFYNITQDEAYTKLKSVFTGETESLKDLGVVMTQTALDQYALQNGFGKTTKSMSEQEKVALRYHFVLDKLSTASGDFSRTSGSWANQVRLLKLQFESLAATIGQVLIAALTPAIRALNAFMGALVKAANTFKSFIFSLFGLESQDMGTGSGSALPDALGNIASGADSAADSLDNAGNAATGAGNAAKEAADKINRSLAGFDKITKLTDNSSSSGGSSGSGGSGGSGSSGGSVGAGSSLGDTSSALTNTAYSVGESNGPLDKIFEKLGKIKELFTGGFWDGLGDLTVFDSIKNNIAAIGQKLKDIFTDADVEKAAQECVGKLATAIGQVVGSIVSIGATIADNLTGGFSQFLTEHEDDIKNWIINVLDIGGDIAETIGNFAADIADIFSVFRGDDAKSITADIIAIFATAFGGTNELALSFASDLISNITKPITDNKDKIKTAFENTLGPISTVISSIADTVQTTFETAKKLYDDHISPLINAVGDTISDCFGILVDGYNEHVAPVLDSLSEKFKDVFETHVQPLIEDIGEAVGSVLDVLKKLWETVLDPLFKWISENIMPIVADLIEITGDSLLEAIKSVTDTFDLFAKGIKAVADWISKVIDWVGKLDFSTIEDGVSGVIEWFEKLPENVTTTIKAVKDKAWDTVVAAFNAIKDSEAIKTIQGAMASAWNTVKGAWDSVVSGEALKTVKATAEKTFDTVKQAWDAVKDKAVKITASVVDNASSWLSDIGKWWNKNKPTNWNIIATVGGALTGLGDWWKNHKPTKWGITAKIGGTLSGLADWWSKNKPTTWGITAKIGGTLSGLADWWDKNKPTKWGITAKIGGTLSGLADWWSKNKPGNWKVTAKVGGSLSGLGDWWENHKPSNWSITAKIAGSLDDFKSWWNTHKPKLSDITAKIKLNAPKITLKYNQKSFGPLGTIKYPTGFSISWHKKGGIFNSASLFGIDASGTAHVAGEAGREAILPLDHNTEWMDKIAGRIVVALNGEKGSSFIENALPRLADVGNGIRNDTAQLVAYAKQAEAAAASGNHDDILQILKEILKILLELDPNVYIDGQKLTARIVAIYNNQARATGRPMIIV